MSQTQTNTAVELEKIKAVYFSTKYMNVKNFLKVKAIKLPDGVVADDLLHWNQEKKEMLEQAKVSHKGMRQLYSDLLQERIDFIQMLNDKLFEAGAELDDVKDLKTLTQALKTISELQDETIKILNIDTTSSEDYENNKSATDNLLKQEDE